MIANLNMLLVHLLSYFIACFPWESWLTHNAYSAMKIDFLYRMKSLMNKNAACKEGKRCGCTKDFHENGQFDGRNCIHTLHCFYLRGSESLWNTLMASYQIQSVDTFFHWAGRRWYMRLLLIQKAEKDQTSQQWFYTYKVNHSVKKLAQLTFPDLT